MKYFFIFIFLGSIFSCRQSHSEEVSGNGMTVCDCMQINSEMGRDPLEGFDNTGTLLRVRLRYGIEYLACDDIMQEFKQKSLESKEMSMKMFEEIEPCMHLYLNYTR